MLWIVKIWLKFVELLLSAAGVLGDVLDCLDILEGSYVKKN